MGKDCKDKCSPHILDKVRDAIVVFTRDDFIMVGPGNDNDGLGSTPIEGRNVRFVGTIINRHGYTLVSAPSVLVKDGAGGADDNPQITNSIYGLVLNVNGKGKDIVYRFEVVAFDGAGGIAVMRPTPQDSDDGGFNAGKPDLYKQNYLKFADYSDLKDGQLVHGIGVASGFANDNLCDVLCQVHNKHTFSGVAVTGVMPPYTCMQINLLSQLESTQSYLTTGSPLVDDNCRIVTMIIRGHQNVNDDPATNNGTTYNVGGLAVRSPSSEVPATHVLKHVGKIMISGSDSQLEQTSRRFIKGYLGVAGAAMTPLQYRTFNGYSNQFDRPTGFVITGVDTNGPCADLLGVGDVITHVNGKEIGQLGSQHAISSRLWFHPPSKPVVLTYYRSTDYTTPVVSSAFIPTNASDNLGYPLRSEAYGGRLFV